MNAAKKHNQAGRLATLRAGHNLTIREVAAKIGRSSSQVTRYETVPTADIRDVVEKFASLYKVSADYILYGEDGPPAEVLEMRRQVVGAKQLIGISSRLITAEYTDKHHRDQLLSGSASFASINATRTEETSLRLGELVETLHSLGILAIYRADQANYASNAVVKNKRESLSKTAHLDGNNALRLFEVADASMEPMLKEREWVFARYTTDTTSITPGSICTIVTPSGVYIRHVSPAESPGDIIAYAVNQAAYFPKQIVASDILEVWALEAKLTSRV